MRGEAMRTIALVFAVVLLGPAWASEQEPAPMVLTFDKIPDDGTCTAADRIAAGIRLEDATGERAATRFDSASPLVPRKLRAPGLWPNRSVR